MKVTAEKTPDSQAVLTIEVEDELVAKYEERAYRKLVNRLNIPGFRKGKAPRFVVERVVGKEGLFHEGVELLFPDVFKDAVEETGIKPIAGSEWDIEQHQPLVLKVTVPLEPTVELGNYQDIRLTREQVEVSDEEVEKVIARLQEDQTTWATVERPAAMGDRVIIDIDAAVQEQPLIESTGGGALITKKGEQLIDRKGVEYPVKEQPDSLLPGLAEQLVGLSDGDEKEFTLTLPAAYPEEHLAGKEAIFKIKCHGVREQRTPELDDEFAKSVGEFANVEELREAVRQDILRHKTAEAEKRYVDTIVQMAVDRSQVEIPQVMIDREVDRAVARLEEQLKESGLTMERYQAMAGKTAEQVRGDFRDSARQRVTSALVLTEIAKAENIEINDEDVQQEIQRLMEGVADEEAAKLRTAFNRPETVKEIGYRLWDRRVVSRLEEIASAEPESTAPEAEAKSDEAAAGELATDETAQKDDAAE